MKLSTALAFSAAPLAMAKVVQNSYPSKRDPMLARRKPEAGAAGAAGAAVAAGTPGTAAAAVPAGNLAAELQALGLSGLGVTSNAVTEVIILWVNPGAGSATTTINPPGAPPGGAAAAATGAPPAVAPPAAGAPPAAAAPAAAAATHQVMVGGTAGLTYQPAQINAAVGDMVVFTFMNANHTVTQSTFEEPCVAMPGGMDSGFQANANNTVNPPPQVAMQVMVDTPLWFYCRQKGHCGKGMTFSINPSAAKTQAMFQSMAIAINGTGAGSALTGGAAAAAPAAAAPAAPAAGNATAGQGTAAAGTGSTGTTTGVGTLQNGQCQCAVTCSAGNLPAANVQGVGAFGGMAGSLPMAMSEPAINAALGA